ncbi:MAG: hypothetical protein Q8K58_10940 [Acidimicrobiales bacterium]|nr:hypothetical protein [Acidimicrobiales bacterium]
MITSQMGLLADVVLTVAYLAIAHSVLFPLARNGQLWRNRLGTSTGLIFDGDVVAVEAGHQVGVPEAFPRGPPDRSQRPAARPVPGRS